MLGAPALDAAKKTQWDKPAWMWVLQAVALVPGVWSAVLIDLDWVNHETRRQPLAHGLLFLSVSLLALYLQLEVWRLRRHLQARSEGVHAL
jgi:hypothetical protein